MKLINWLLFVCFVLPFLVLGIGIFCAFISLKQGIECAGELLDE